VSDFKSAPEPFSHSESFEIGPSRLRQAGRLIFGLLLLAVAVDTWRLARLDDAPMDYIASALFGILGFPVTALALRELLRVGPTIVLSPRGFKDRRLGIQIPWEVIQGVGKARTFPLLPALEIHCTRAGNWPARIPLWRRVPAFLLGRRSRRGRVLVAVGGLNRRPREILDLADRFDRNGFRRRRLRHEARHPAVPRWQRWLDTWLGMFWSREMFAVPVLGFFGISVIWMGVSGIAHALVPDVQVKGTLVAYEVERRGGHLEFTMRTAAGELVATSATRDHSPSTFLLVRPGDEAVVTGHGARRKFRAYGLTVRDAVVLDRGETRRRARREGLVFIAGGCLGLLAAGFLLEMESDRKR
jgi:hypothetical protein